MGHEEIHEQTKMLISILLDDAVMLDSKAPAETHGKTVAAKLDKKIDEPSQSSDDEKVVDAFSDDSSQKAMDGLEDDIFERGDTLGKSYNDTKPRVDLYTLEADTIGISVKEHALPSTKTLSYAEVHVNSKEDILGKEIDAINNASITPKLTKVKKSDL